MNKLPILISVPHAGIRVPDEYKEIFDLTDEEITQDNDEGAAEIYGPLEDRVMGFVTTDIPRAVVDVNRSASDFSQDGVTKTHSCYMKRVWTNSPEGETRRRLLEMYYFPYHKKLSDLAENDALEIGLDCHTMAEFAPPISQHEGNLRPYACISDSYNPSSQLATDFAGILERILGKPVAINDPFKGGYITQMRSGGLPWLQIEFSRSDWISNREKSEATMESLVALIEHLHTQDSP